MDKLPDWIKNLIESHPEYFEEDKIEWLYSQAPKLGGIFGAIDLSSALLGAGIDPLEYCTSSLPPYIGYRQNLIQTKLKINPGIDTISMHCFEDSNIRTLDTNNVVKIQDFGFLDCKNLTEITLPKVVDVHKGAFEGCVSLVTVNWIDSNQGYVGDMAFSFCTSLKTLELPDGVMSIGNKFLAHSGVETLYLPDTLEDIVFGSISQAGNLKSVYYGGTVEQWKHINGSKHFSSATIKLVHCIDGDSQFPY